MDFFDVVDYPVRGYDSPQVITELHQHLWDCAVDYRPINLPLRCVLTLGSLSVSSNIAARTKTSTLRFIAEDANLFISDKISQRVPVDLRLDYISVIELGLFELSLRLSDLSSSPKVDLRASNNVLHIRTCSDSAHALAQLITYFASDGDLSKSEEKKKSKANEEILVQTITENENLDIDLTESTVERVNVMMEDAMKDVNGSDSRKNKKMERNLESGVEVFFFPDEGSVAQHDAVTPVDWAGSDIDSEHDFCMLEHETGSGIVPQSGLPEVRVITATPILIVDNHFGVAFGKVDMLSPPKHYPTPIYRYTLRDMTLIWHMYGGQDFNIKYVNKKHITIHERYSFIYYIKLFCNTVTII
ncbi:hypothetical protein AAG570_012492 [Ranatra chinensis]|uniref:Autophagy-related protein 2 n=1 Tax=Ranatra chinensis TaxID=642074 RepID=A0ABD0YSP3_9HEMI